MNRLLFLLPFLLTSCLATRGALNNVAEVNDDLIDAVTALEKAQRNPDVTPQQIEALERAVQMAQMEARNAAIQVPAALKADVEAVKELGSKLKTSALGWQEVGSTGIISTLLAAFGITVHRNGREKKKVRVAREKILERVLEREAQGPGGGPVT
jgi:hypothetical protein